MRESSKWLGKNILCSPGGKELQEIMDRCTGCCDIPEIMLKWRKMPKHQSINQSGFDQI